MSIASIPRALSLEYLDTNLRNGQPTSFFQNIKFALTHITLEPLVFIYAVSSVLTHLSTTNLNLEKACRVHLQYNASVCDAMNQRDKFGYTENQEAEVQKVVSILAAFKSLCMGLFPSILVIFFGSWSDRHGRRKPVILVPIIGEGITCICLFLCSYFFYELPLVVNALSESIPISTTGGWFCLFVGIYSYASAISSEKNKTGRIGAFSLCMNIGITAGIFLSGFLIKLIGNDILYMFWNEIYSRFIFRHQFSKLYKLQIRFTV